MKTQKATNMSTKTKKNMNDLVISPKDPIELKDIVKVIENCNECCGNNNCIKNAFKTDGVYFEEKCKAAVLKYRNIIHNMTKFEKDSFIISKFKKACLSLNQNGRNQMSYQIKNYKNKDVEICGASFLTLFDITKYKWETVSRAIKSNEGCTELAVQKLKDVTLFDYTHSQAMKIIESNIKSGTYNVNELVVDGLTPYAESNQFARIWIDNYFNNFADSKPNHITIHAALTYRKDLWEQYKLEMELINQSFLDESYFNRLWHVLFPFYEIRQWLNVPGKCDICMEIDKVRRTSTDKDTLSAAKQAHLLHKAGMFGLERRKYKEKVLLAKQPGSETLVMIIDGMDQFHSKLPHNGQYVKF